MRNLWKWIYWLPAASWAGTLFWMSDRPAGPQIPTWFLLHDKVTHAAVFGFLATLIFFALRIGHRARLGPALALAWLLTVVYGGSDEIHQLFVPTRQSDWFDWLADATGAAIALGTLTVASYSYRRITPRTMPPITSD